jgi:hypothetical protein
MPKNLWAAVDRETNARSTGSVVRTRPTVGWLAMAYSSLVPDVSTERVKQVLVKHGLPLGAAVEHDDAVSEAAPPATLNRDATGRRGVKCRRPAE